MRLVRKACACLLREGGQGTEVLVFDHPVAGTQLPKGTVEVGEHPEVAVVRELAEETGVVATVTRSLGEWRRVTGAGPDEAGESEEHVWEIFEMRTAAAVHDAWRHTATGSEAEQGLEFNCRWLRLVGAAEELHPMFHPAVALLREAQANRG